MELNYSLLFYLKKPKNYTSGNIPVYMRFTVNGLPKECATTRTADPDKWCANTGRENGKTEPSRSLNFHLDDLQQKVHNVHAQMVRDDEEITSENGLIGPIESHTENQIRAQFDTNFFGTISVIRAFIPYFRERNKGLFINTTSLCGLVSNPQSAIYNASKWALQGLAESLSYDLAQFNIGIKNIAPGGIKTEFTKAMHVTEDKAYEATMAKMMEDFQDGTLMEFTEAEQIAEVVYTAATDNKDQLTYPAGNDAVRLYAKRLAKGPETYRINLTKYLNFQSPYENQ